MSGEHRTSGRRGRRTALAQVLVVLALAIGALPLLSGSTLAVQPNLTFSKSGPATVADGGTVTYTIGVQNGGTVHSQPVTVTDTVDAALTNVQASPQGSCSVNGNAVSCSLGPIAAGGSASVTITATAPTGTCPKITNFAKVNEGSLPPIATNTVVTQVTGCAPNLTFSKSGPATVAQGGTVSYSIGVQNTGTVDSEPVTVTDTVDAALTNVQASASQGSCSVNGNAVSCSLGPIAAGGSASVTITATAPTGTCPTISNSAEVQQGNQPPQSTNTVTTTVTGCDTPNVEITKSASTATVAVGGSFSYTIVVSNTGNGPAQNVVVTDSIPAGLTITNVSGPGCSVSGQNVTCNVGTLAAGASATITITVTATATACPSVTNTAHVTFADGQGGTGSANSNAVAVGVNCEPGVQIVKDSDAPGRGVDSGDSFSYTITITNDGNATAEGIIVTDTIPSGLTIDDVNGPGCSVQGQVVTCNVGNLAAGASVTITVDVTATDDACPEVENFAHVEWVEGDETVSEDSNTVHTDVDCVGGETVTPTTPPPSATTTTPPGTAFTGPDEGAVRLGVLAIALLLLGSGLMFAGYRRRARSET